MDGVVVVGARDDGEVRAQGAGGEGDEDVVGVVGDGGDQARRALDPRVDQHLVLAGVAVDDRQPLRGGLVERRLVDVDHHEGDALAPQVAGDLPPDAAVAAEDVVAGELLHAPFHPP